MANKFFTPLTHYVLQSRAAKCNHILGLSHFVHCTFICALRSALDLAPFARASFALCAHKKFLKKKVSQSTKNALKCREMLKTFFTPLTQAQAAKRNITYLMSPPGLKEYSCQVSYLSVQNWPLVGHGQTDRQTDK